jgi:hypothetical protein
MRVSPLITRQPIDFAKNVIHWSSRNANRLGSLAKNRSSATRSTSIIVPPVPAWSGVVPTSISARRQYEPCRLKPHHATTDRGAQSRRRSVTNVRVTS